MRRDVILLGCMLGCAGTSPRDAVWRQHAEALSGRWVVQMEFGPSPDPRAAPKPPARGTLTLTPNLAVDDARADGAPSTDYGTYAIDFSALGFNPSGTQVPGVFVGVQRGDSLYVAFETDRPSFEMWMTAPLATDSIRGRWVAQQSRTTIAAGTFIMSRQ